MLHRRQVATTLALVALASVAPPTSALAAGHSPIVSADILGALGGLAGGVFSGIGHAVLGAFSWTIGLASKFILTTLAALVHMLIPHSWLTKGLQVMRWLVAVPDYAGQITTPGGGHSYGFAGINALRDVFTWLGVAAAPLTLVYATSRALIGDGDPIGIPVLRMLATAVVIISYPYWWSQAASLADQVTNAILSVPSVAAGLQRLMEYAVGGVALGGWQLIDLGLMGATGLALLALIFLKVVVVLLGALLYATGPVMIGLVPTRAGSGLARAWGSAAAVLLGLGIVWASVFAVGAVLIGDSATAGPLIAGNSGFGSLVGGLLLAVAGVASLWICLKVAKEAGGLLRMQLAGLLVFTGSGRPGTTPTGAATASRTTGASLRTYRSRLAAAGAAAGAELAVAGGAGAGIVAAGRAAGFVGRRGLIGTAATGATAAGAKVAPAGARVMERSRAGAVAARMARSGTASWAASRSETTVPPASRRPGRGHATRREDNMSDGRAARPGGTDHKEPAAPGPKAPRQQVGATADSDRPGDDAPSHASTSDGPRQPSSVAGGPERTQSAASQGPPERRTDASRPDATAAPARAEERPSSTTKTRGAMRPSEPGARDRTPRPGSQQ